MINAEDLAYQGGRLLPFFMAAQYVIQGMWLYRARFRIVHVFLALLPMVILSSVGVSIIAQIVHLATPAMGLAAVLLSDFISVTLCYHLVFLIWYKKPEQAGESGTVPGEGNRYSGVKTAIVLGSMGFLFLGLLGLAYWIMQSQVDGLKEQVMEKAMKEMVAGKDQFIRSTQDAYVNRHYGFSLAFPEGWEYRESSVVPLALVAKRLENSKPVEAITITVIKLMSSPTLAEFYANNLRIIEPDKNGFEEGLVSINGSEARWFSDMVNNSGGIRVSYFLIHNGKGYVITYVSASGGADQAQENGGKIMQTFSFSN